MTHRRPLRTALVAVLSAAALVGCGHKEDVVTEGTTEGIWVDVGSLDYHIQGSRILNPEITPDRSYLDGLPATVDPAADPDEVWFAIFLRVENKTDAPAPTAREFAIVDTEDREYTPYGIDPDDNGFAYRPIELGPGDAIPITDSPQDFNSFSGAVLVFKLPLEGYQNRPLTLRIHSAEETGPEEAELDLDV